MKAIFIPALRGIFGDWVYYSCILPVSEFEKRVSFADDLHKNKELSMLIQRELKTKRGAEIANYLKNEKERFFSSFVVAVYGGEPCWYPSNIKPDCETIDIELVSEDALDSLGFLRLSGEERLFALDGQHRLAGIKNAQKQGTDIADDEVSFILVAHKDDATGIQRTRRLFTTLNKQAVAVSKGEIISLDENDIMAIVSRMMVEKSELFSKKRIAIKTTNNISDKDLTSLTTIGNLYDVLGIVFAKIKNITSLQTLKKSQRPTDQAIEEYYRFAESFFIDLAKAVMPIKEFFDAKKEEDVVKKYRGAFGGNILFRPLGLIIITEVIAKIAETKSIDYAFAVLKDLPMSLSEKPYIDAFWIKKTSSINPKAKAVVRDMLLVEAGVYSNSAKKISIQQKYDKILNP
jgi:DNA sulfur modification protein DndB